MPEIRPFYYIVKTRIVQNYLNDTSNPLGLPLIPVIDEGGALTWSYQIPDQYRWALPGDGEWYLLGCFSSPQIAKAVVELLHNSPAVQFGYTEVDWELWSVRTIEEHVAWNNPDELFPQIDAFYPEGAINLNEGWTVPWQQLDEFLNPPSTETMTVLVG